MDQIYVPEWVEVKSETREKIRALFAIPKSSSTQVETNSIGMSKVHSDGCTNSDLQSLTVDKMITYLGGATDNDTIRTLFKKVVAKVEEKVDATPQAPKINDNSVKKCEFCEYSSVNPRALSMHKIGKHRNR